jgi:ribosome recycling factor
MTQEYLDDMKGDFEKVEDAFKRELSAVRTGRASPKLLENVQVEVAAYGSRMPINQLATVSAPDARLLIVNPWDKGTISDIEKGVLAAGLGLNPSNDGSIIHVPIPALTEERRRDMVRAIRKMLEEAKVRARGVRRDYNDTFKELEAEKEISEDELKRALDLVQSATDASVKSLDAVADSKEQEILEV